MIEFKEIELARENDVTATVTRMKTIDKKTLVDAAIAILAKEPKGLRTEDLFKRRLWPQFPDKGFAGAHGMLVDYAREPEAKIYQPRRGIRCGH
jgi:hypothetical protein